MKEILEKYERKTLIRGGISIIIYILWVFWIQNFWFLLGLPIVFDMYITKKVNWSPWKKRNGENSTVIEWIDALIFAIIAVTIINIFLFQNYKIPTGSMEKSLRINDHLYVSKVAYGPRTPNTPLALPFMQHTIPGTTKKSFVTWPSWDYKRLKGFKKIERFEPVVFNFPEGDTVIFEQSTQSYYAIVRDRAEYFKNIDINSNKPLQADNYYYNKAREFIWDNTTIVVRPVDKTDNYIKRCVAIAGDTLKIVNGTIYVNGEMEPNINGRQYAHIVNTNGARINQRYLDKLDIYSSDVKGVMGTNFLEIPMNNETAEKLRALPTVEFVEQRIAPEGAYSLRVFPHSPNYPWNEDNFGPLYIPKRGATIEINMTNLPIYERAIGHYEKNKLEVKDSVIYINGEIANSYTFKMNYYWMMGDNRHNSLDSRFWGFVPEDHIIGKPRFIWLAVHKDKSFPKSIQLKRMFRIIR